MLQMLISYVGDAIFGCCDGLPGASDGKSLYHAENVEGAVLYHALALYHAHKNTWGGLSF
jgi:hypothetical protein